jgi:phosphocarrier protein
MSQDPDVARRRVAITNAYGFHVRPAQKFVGVAAKFRSEIRVHFQGRSFNGKSILDLITMAAECGSELDLEAKGPDAGEAIADLTELVEANFHEVDPYAEPPPTPGDADPAAGPPGGPAT